MEKGTPMGAGSLPMIKKKMILADRDQRYLNELSHYFMENVPQLELIVFTRKEKLYQYLEQGGTADILIVDETLAEEKLREMASDMTRMVLFTDLSPVEGFEPIKKYQKIENISTAVLLRYAEENDSLETVRGDSETKVVAFYSPAGGTGKTVLALALASAAVRAGSHTLYLNLEEIDSVSDLLGKTTGGLSDVFLALKTKGMNVGIKLKGCICTEPTAGFDYLPGVDSISEYEEISREDHKRLLDSLRELADHHLVVVDLSSDLNDRAWAILEEADRILVPTIAEGRSLSKLQRLLDESRLHDRYERLFQKMYLIINKADGRKDYMGWLPHDISSRLPCCANVMMSSILARGIDILRSGDMLLQMMGPVLQVAMGDDIP